MGTTNGGEAWPDSMTRCETCWLAGVLATVAVAALLTVGLTVSVGGSVDAVGVAGHTLTGLDGDASIGVTAPTARLAVYPNPVEPGETTTLDASNSTTDQGDIVECDFDVDGDGSFEVVGDDDCVVTQVYNQVGQYNVTVRAWDSQQQTNEDTVLLTVAENQPPNANFTWSPSAPSPGDSIEFDASGATDSDGDIVEYRWDFDDDGSVDAVRQTPTVTHTFTDPGSYPVTLEVVDDDGATDTITREVPVDGNPIARCTVSATTVEPGEQVIIDASDSNAELVRFDVTGDGEFDRTNDADFTEVVTYADPGTYTPAVRAEIGQQSDSEECSTITVAENEPPTAAFTVNPNPGTVGDPITFDAGDSKDPDGEIVEYRWDWDNDDHFEQNTTAESVTHTFAEPGFKTVQLLVVDDAGATDLEVLQSIEVEAASTTIPDADASCVVSKDEVVPGEQVEISVFGSDLQTVEVDVDGDGTYDEFREGDTAITVSYDETGRYEPSALVTDERQRTAEVDCGPISVVEPDQNQPPDAQLTHRPGSVEPGETVVLDASGSDDPDGSIVIYRWDFDNDGDFEDETTVATVRHTFEEPGSHTVRLVVADAAGQTDETIDVVDVSGGICAYIPLPFVPTELLCAFLPLVIILVVGGVGGCMVCRWVRAPRTMLGGADADGGLTRYGAGMIELPAVGETVAVSDLGFEPDLVVLTASNAVVSAPPDQVIGTTVGWSYGAARRTGDGSIVQHAVAVADDARYPDVAVAAAVDGQSVSLIAETDQRVGRVAGRVKRTTDSGFEMSTTADDVADRFGGRPVVLYRAFQTARPEDVDVGYFGTPTAPGLQTVDIAPEMNHVTLTACTALDDMDRVVRSRETVGLSTGDVVADRSIRQIVTAGTVAPSAEGFSGTGAADDRAIHLPYQRGPAIDGRTTASATSLDDGLELEYDEVHADDTATPTGGPPLVSYVALWTGEGLAPAVGYFRLPGPADEGARSVTTGFEPALVEFTVVAIDELGERVASASPFPWGRSHGVAIASDEGIDQYLLHGAVDPDRTAGEPEAATGRLRSTVAGAGIAANGGSGAHITGRDDLAVTAMTPRGFDVRTTHVSTDARDPTSGNGKLVFYKAWPIPDQ